MRPFTMTQAGTGTSTPLVLDSIADPFSVGLFLTCPAATTATVQLTGDPPFSTVAWLTTGANWQNFAAMNATTASGSSQLDYPATGIRLVNTGTGTATLQILSGGHAKSA